MKLNKLSLKDRGIFNRYLDLSRHELSVYAFENIYPWRALFDIHWTLINKNLCVFFKDRFGFFLYLPPLGEVTNPDTVSEAFKIMDKFNQNEEVSRIENVEERDLRFYGGLGYRCSQKYPEYLCRRADLAQLKGNRFKSKRSSFNYFTKHNRFRYLPFLLCDSGPCLELFESWKEERMANNGEPVYTGMLQDASVTLKALLKAYKGLNITARVVKVNGSIKAFTFGFKLNADTFCIFYEVADLSVKGLAQFIFCMFARELKGYRYINIMDDSGLENLKKVKLSYQPVRLVPAYIAKRRK